jgi:hypothetical protein
VFADQPSLLAGKMLLALILDPLGRSIGDPHPNGGKTCAGLASAGYTVAMRHARLDGLHAAAIAAVASLVFYVPIYAALSRGSLFNAPVADWRSSPLCWVPLKADIMQSACLKGANSGTRLARERHCQNSLTSACFGRAAAAFRVRASVPGGAPYRTKRVGSIRLERRTASGARRQQAPTS